MYPITGRGTNQEKNAKNTKKIKEIVKYEHNSRNGVPGSVFGLLIWASWPFCAVFSLSALLLAFGGKKPVFLRFCGLYVQFWLDFGIFPLCICTIF